MWRSACYELTVETELDPSEVIGGIMLRCVSVLLAITFVWIGASAQKGPPGSEAAPGTRKTAARVASAACGRSPSSHPERPARNGRLCPALPESVRLHGKALQLYVCARGGPKPSVGDPNRPSHAEKAEAYSSLVAATGTYSLSDRTLTLEALIYKNPNEMTGKPLTYTLEADGKTLRMVIADPPFLPGRESRTVLTKVE